jgi:ATP-dependent Clp protease protease subunit
MTVINNARIEFLMNKLNKDLSPTGIIQLDGILSGDNTISPEMYQYYRNLNERKIIINDEITSSLLEYVITPLIEMDNDGTGKSIHIYLQTIGGSLTDGFVLCDIIDNIKTPLTIEVLGYAYSMGGIILMSGYKNDHVHKICHKHSTALLHAGSYYLEGNANSVKDQFHFNEKMEEQIRDYTLSHSKITNKEYERMDRYEWYLLSDEMLKYGLVDEIIGV